MSDSPLLKLSSITKDYQLSESQTLQILKGISLEIKSGESVAVVGPSGCGKSTLLNLMGALDRPTAGSVVLEGKDLSTLNDEDAAGLRNQTIGFVFQLHHLLPHLSVWENVLVPTMVLKSDADKKAAAERAERLLQRVGLQDRKGHHPAQLSGGEQQRVAVVRALVNGPKLLLADEPTGALDQKSADNLSQLLVELNKEENVTLVVVTHSNELAKKMGRKVQMVDGILE